MIQKFKTTMFWFVSIVLILGVIFAIRFFSEESQNKAKRYFGNQMGYTHGRVDTANPKMVFLQVEKLTSASATDGASERTYRYGYGYFDLNLNGVVDLNEKKIGKNYFDVNDFTGAVFRDMGTTEFEKSTVSQNAI